MGNVDNQIIYNQIQNASQRNQLVVFIGAGMSNNFGYPTWNALVKRMYQELSGNPPKDKQVFSADELLRIPQMLRSTDKALYENILKGYFQDKKNGIRDNVILDEVMKLKPKHIITTNFDTLIEQYLEDKEDAFSKMHSLKEGYDKIIKNQVPYKYFPVIKDSDMITADANHLLMKMHGDVYNMDSMVLCEDDYLNYSNSHVLMENFIKSLLINHTFLFVGYGVGDSNLKLIMNWVDNIASREKGIVEKRQKHILLYSEKKPMDEFQRAYFENKQILVLEYSRLPAAYRKIAADEFADERGKNLVRLLKAAADKVKPDKPDAEKVQEVLRYFQNKKAVHIWEVSRVAGSSRNTWKAGDKLILMHHFYGDGVLASVVKAAGSRNNGDTALQAKELLGKLGAARYGKYLQEKTYTVPCIYDDVLEKLCLTHDYAALKKYVHNSGKFSASEKAYWALYLDDGKNAERLFEKIILSKDKKSLYDQVQTTFNLQQVFELEDRYEMHFVKLWNRIPEREQMHFALLKEYMSGCRDLYQGFGVEADRLRLKYSTAGRGKDTECPHVEFEVRRTEILDFIRCMVLNGFYITGLWSNTTHFGGMKEMALSYADTLMFLMSPEVKRRQSWFALTAWDIYLLINLTGRGKLKDMAKAYKVHHLVMDRECREVLLNSCLRLLEKGREVLRDSEHNGHMANELADNCFQLMMLVKWDREEIEHVMEEAFKYLSKVLTLEKEDRIFVIREYTLYDFLKQQFDEGHRDLVAAGAGKLLCRLIRSFLKEDHAVKYSKILDINMDWYRDTAFISMILKDECGVCERKLIDQFWQTYKKDYPSHVSEGLVDFYILSGEETKVEIGSLINKKVTGMGAGLLRYCLESGAVSYDQAAEGVLLRQCERFFDLSEEHRSRVPLNDSPLTHVLRLFQEGIIRDINPYQKYKDLNKWFSFVCFPEEFDFAGFEVEGWCTWLEAEPYRSVVQGNNRRIVKALFEKEIENGAGEEVRRIYYKYLE